MSFELLIEKSEETIFEMDCASKDEALNKSVEQVYPLCLCDDWDIEEDGENITLTKEDIVISITKKV